MSERDEINLRAEQQNWQTKQDLSGTVTAVLSGATACAFFYFFNSPSSQSATLLGLSMFLLILAAFRLLICAGKVVEVRNSLQPVIQPVFRSRPAPAPADIIEVEVVAPQEVSRFRQLSQFSGDRWA